MSKLKAVITMNRHGTYVVEIERHHPNRLTQTLDRDFTWTLRGAQRRARKMLSNAELADEYAKFREVIE